MINNQLISTVGTLRQSLHGLAERSGQEEQTKAYLMEYLRANTSLRLEDNGQWFCAVHEEPQAKETMAFRADMDALPFGDGAAHLCGHDGHSAVLAGLGLWLEGRSLGRNIVLIFQHAEETGAGGAVCAQVLKTHAADRVYAFHNIPGWETGTILLRHGTFACASRGMTLSFKGAPSHAAYPEFGKNPGFAAAHVISALPELVNTGRWQGLTMATLVGAQIGEKAFGCAAGSAELWLTLRAWHDRDLHTLADAVIDTAEAAAFSNGIRVSHSFCDSFPATVNDSDTLARLEQVCREAGLPCADVSEPFRWSEDFGYYGSLAQAVMVGIGDGLSWPQLHTEAYVFPDDILPQALTLFSALAENG